MQYQALFSRKVKQSTFDAVLTDTLRVKQPTTKIQMDEISIIEGHCQEIFKVRIRQRNETRVLVNVKNV